MATITDRDVRKQITTAIEASHNPGDFDVDGITEHIIRVYGLVNIDTISSDEFWGVLFLYDNA